MGPFKYDCRRIRQHKAKSGRDLYTTKFMDILDQILGPKEKGYKSRDHYEVCCANRSVDAMFIFYLIHSVYDLVCHYDKTDLVYYYSVVV